MIGYCATVPDAIVEETKKKGKKFLKMDRKQRREFLKKKLIE
ncbi:MAG: hypothetical protein ABSB40_05425 [Nitrososphaeria archaeon]|jgi:hypothetical protein